MNSENTLLLLSPVTNREAANIKGLIVNIITDVILTKIKPIESQPNVQRKTSDTNNAIIPRITLVGKSSFKLIINAFAASFQ